MPRILGLIVLIGLGYLAYTHYGYRYYLSQVKSNADEQMVIGPRDASITIVAYLDYNAPSSKRIYTTLINLLTTDRDIKMVIRPVESENKISQLTTRLALAAKRQDKFMVVNNFFLTSQYEIDNKYIQGVMRTMGLKYDRLKTVMDSDAVTDEAVSYVREAKLLGIQSLPYFYIEHVKMPGARIYTQSELREVIERLRTRRL